MVKRTVSLILTLAMVFMLSVPCFAMEKGEKRAVIAADLSENAVEQIYKDFGIERGSVKELTVTNKNEREYLEGLVEDSKIGNVALSCVYIETLEEGSGLDIEINNIKWCTEPIYKNAFITAGITL